MFIAWCGRHRENDPYRKAVVGVSFGQSNRYAEKALGPRDTAVGIFRRKQYTSPQQ